MIQLLRGTQSQLNSYSTIIPDGQPVFERDTGQLKIGTGSARYSNLPYVGSIFESSGGDTNLVYGGNSSEGYIDFPGGLRVCYGSFSRTISMDVNIPGNGTYGPYGPGAGGADLVRRGSDISNLKTTIISMNLFSSYDSSTYRGDFSISINRFDPTGSYVCRLKGRSTFIQEVYATIYYQVWSID